MKRLVLMAGVLLMLSVGAAHASESGQRLTPPKSGTIKVAVVINEGATLMDFVGPWEVFENVLLGDQRETEEAVPFELYTVAPSKDPIHAESVHRAGPTIVPDYDFDTAPTPDVVVIGAQATGPGMLEWLKKMHSEQKLVLSVCTGSFKLVRAGVLDGDKPATTHHWHFNQFSTAFPGVPLVRGVRYVQGDTDVYSAGGGLSGVDLALHVVEAYFGTAQAQATADRIEYIGDAWKTNKAVSVPATVVHEDWRGELAPGVTINVRIAIQGPDMSAMMTSGRLHAQSVPATVTGQWPEVRMVFAMPGLTPATFEGTDNAADTTITGTYTQDGKSSPLVLIKQKRVKGVGG
jgi:putative intracellular protease/amidase